MRTSTPTPKRLTDKQREHLANEGYIVIEQALSATEIERLTYAVDSLFEQHFTEETPKSEKKPGGGQLEDRSRALANAIEKSDELIGLLDHPVTFPLVLDLLGPYINLGLSEITQKRPFADTGDQTGFIHSDGGHSLSRTWVDENSRPLLMKTHYFLTDCNAPDMGNFAVVPGSHRRAPYWEPGEDTTPAKTDAVPLLMKAGDCAMWTHSLWHGAMPNRSSVTRKTITFGYNQMFIRALAEPPSQKLLDKCTLRQRRLLGDLGSQTRDHTWGTPLDYFYAPSDYADIMLGN